MSPLKQPRTQTGAMTNVFYLILKRMRFPLIFIASIYTLCVSVLAVVPGVDEAGNPTPGMGLFHAFYVISYTGSSIGFGEIPTTWSAGQRLWMTVSIYLSVIGWSFTIVNIFALLADGAFRRSLAESRFARQIKALREPFYIVCGCGETGTLVCHGLDRIGYRFVMIEADDQRLQELQLEDFHADAPMIVADGAQPTTLLAAGLRSPHCRGVMALAVDDETNRSIAVTVRLLAPRVPVLAKVGDVLTENFLARFGGDVVINPFERFAQHLASAIASPERYRLREIVTGLVDTPLPEPHRPPRGRWIMCGYGRFGHMIREELEGAGLDVTVIDEKHFGEPGVDIKGSGIDTESLMMAGITTAAGIVAGNASDQKNLAIAITARELNPSIFVVTRQNQMTNSPLFDAFEDDLAMQPSRIVAREFLALITTPLLSRFLEAIQWKSEEWCRGVATDVAKLNHRRIPEVWSLHITNKQATAVHAACQEGEQVTLGQLLTDPRRPGRRRLIKVLMLHRDGEDEEIIAPDDDVVLKAGDNLLLAGSLHAQMTLEWVSSNANVLDVIRRGNEAHTSWIWRKFDKRTSRGKRPKDVSSGQPAE